MIAAEGDGYWREYVGGYSDWERVHQAAQARVDAQVRSAAAKSADKAPARPAADAGKPKKRSYKEQRLLEQLPQQIATWEQEQREISQRMADPALYQADADEAQRLTRRFAELDDLLLQALESWEQLEAGSGA